MNKPVVNLPCRKSLTLDMPFIAIYKLMKFS